MNHFSAFLSLLFLVTACRPEFPQINPPEKSVALTPTDEFDAFWTGMNNSYAFWDIDPTDWDAVYRTYRPLFAKLKSDDESSRKKGYTYYQEMTANLIDSHYALYFKDHTLPAISPSNARILKRPGLHQPIPVVHYQKTIPANYLSAGAVTGVDTSESSPGLLVAGKIKNTNILYFRFPQFALSDWYADPTSPAQAVIQYVFDELKKSDLDGIILDLRGNGGGNAPDLDFLLGRLIDKAYVFGSLRAKAGMGRLDYLPWFDFTVHAVPGARPFTKPIVALVDMFSVSMAEITPMAIKALPTGNGKLVGERTWGGTGPLTQENVRYNGGEFSTSVLARVYTSSLMFRYKDGKIYEGIGVPPDVEANYNGEALKTGKDTQLETAISQIR